MTAPSPKIRFKQRVRNWATRLDVRVAWLGVRPMRNKWASCSTEGHLNFNAELLNMDEQVWDYVIVHELLHFFVPNHGKLWKSLMRAHLSDYDATEAELKKMAQIKPQAKKP
ncbi:MAG: M48 family metallopeptidase [Chlorobiaceae bacterium]|nr:M48 family metallopeptidase [Chlorobiaceae bacterium]